MKKKLLIILSIILIIFVPSYIYVNDYYHADTKTIDAQLLNNPNELNYISNEKRIVLTNSFIGISDEIDVSDFIKDGMIKDVKIASSGTDLDGEEHLEADGPYIHIIWNTDGGNKDTWLSLNELVNIYTSDDSGIKVNDYKISLNYNEISEKLEVPTLQNYVKELSSPNGIIDTLSAGVDNALSSDILAIKFCGHITLF
jgi:hypothetical protein